MRPRKEQTSVAVLGMDQFRILSTLDKLALILHTEIW